jgi:hypothetical protein
LLSSNWFEQLTGFREESPDQVRSSLSLEGSTLYSKINGRKMEAGRLDVISLERLRSQVDSESPGQGALSISEVVADARELHLSHDSEGALFQVASQFNLLEMISPSVTPEEGISIYARDPTQGPACAITAGAGTIYRNYFAPVNGKIGQSVDNQIDCLQSVGSILGNRQESLWSMQNGYALASERGLRTVNATLGGMDASALDNVGAALCTGIQWDTEVTIDGGGHLVSQIYCSALPVAYSAHPPNMWERFARLILEATYEAAFAAAAVNWGRTGNRKLYLTLVGGGVFGNEPAWILSAIQRAAIIFSKHPLDVHIVSHRMPNPHLKAIL